MQAGREHQRLAHQPPACQRHVRRSDDAVSIVLPELFDRSRSGPRRQRQVICIYFGIGETKHYLRLAFTIGCKAFVDVELDGERRRCAGDVDCVLSSRELHVHRCDALAERISIHELHTHQRDALAERLELIQNDTRGHSYSHREASTYDTSRSFRIDSKPEACRFFIWF